MRSYAVALILVTLVSLSFALTNVTSCMLINGSDTYVLQNDLFNGSTPTNPNTFAFSTSCIRIASPNTVLDCAGHSITGNGSVDLGVVVDEEPTTTSNVTVKNCVISNYHIPLYTLAVTGSEFTNVTAFNNTLDGMFFNMANSNVTSNTAYGNPDEGIFIYGSGNNLSGNTVCNNTGDGFKMTGFYSTASNTFGGNTICGNGGDGMSADISSGLLTIFSSGNHFYNNSGHDVGMYSNVSLQMTDDAFDNPAGDMKDFTVLSLSDANATGGYTINWTSQPAAPPAGLQAVGGRFLNISQATANESIDSASWSWSDSEPLAPLESMFQLWRFDSLGWTLLNSSPDTSANTLSVSNEVPGSVYSVMLNATCPAPINASGTYTLSGDAAGEPNDASDIAAGAMACVKIGAPNVVFDCGGFNVVGDGSAATSYGIALNGSASNVTVQNCPGVRSYSVGVMASGVNNTLIRNTTSAGNGEGFVLSGLGNNSFSSDLSANNSGSGFSIVTGNNSVVSSSDSIGNNGNGFSIVAGNGLFMPIDNAIGNNGSGFSIVAGNGASFPIENATGNNGTGFSATVGDSASFPIVTATNNNGAGFVVSAGNSASFAIDTATNNNGAGFVVSSGDVASFAACTVQGNNGAGFVVSTGNFPDFSANDALSNNGAGFVVSSGNASLFSANTVLSNNGTGFVVSSGSSSNFTANTAGNNSGSGFVVSTGPGGIFGNNSASGNGGTGFSIAPGDGTSFSTDNASGNAGSGFVISGSTNSTFSGELAGTNGGSGFVLSGGDQNAISGLTAAGNAVSGLGVSGANNTLVSGAHLFGNSPDLLVVGSSDQLNMSSVVFDSAGGNYSNYTNISLGDLVDSSFSISHATQPAALPTNEISFAGKFVNITSLSGNTSIDSLVFHWLDSEVTAGGYNEGFFNVYDYNGTWFPYSNLPDTTANTLSLSNVTRFSVYGILQASAPSGGGGTSGGGGPLPALSISFNSTSGVVTVTSGGSPVPGATVKEDGVLVGTTDSNGQITIPGCNQSVTIDALMGGYTAASAAVTLMACSAQPPACTTDDNCSSAQACVAGACVAVNCPNGSVVNHQCVQNQTNQCTSPSCCTNSSVCSDTQACVTPSGAPPTQASPGSCQQVTGQCGYAANHAFVPYNYTCGTEPGCPSCPSGQSCVEHQCVQYGLSCPSGGVVGATVTCNATQNGQACPDCNYTVTDPSGATTSGQANPDGSITLPLNSAGQYRVSVMGAGAAVNSAQIVASAPAQQPPAQPPSPPVAAGPDLLSLVWLLVLLIIVIAAVIYWRSRSGKR